MYNAPRSASVKCIGDCGFWAIDRNTFRKTIEEIAKTGANAVKLQTEAPINITLESDHDEFMIKGGAWNGQSLYELYKKTYTPFEWHLEIKELVEKYDVLYIKSIVTVS